MNRFFTFAIVLSLTAFPALGDDAIQWGAPDNGLRVGLSSETASVPAGQEPLFTVTVQNVSPQDLSIPAQDTFVHAANPDSDDYHERPLAPLVVDTQPPDRNPSGLYSSPSPTYSIGDSGPPVQQSPPHVLALKAGGSVAWKNVSLDQLKYFGDRLPQGNKTTVQHWMLIPGRQYNVQFQFANEQARVLNQKVWTGKAVTGAIVLQVDAPGKEGIKLDARFTVPKTRYFVGEPIEVTFHVTNQGGTAVEYPYGGDYRSTGRPDRFKIAAINSAGKPVPDPVVPGGMGGGLGSSILLKPGESHEDTLLANHWCAFTAPGTYTITCKRRLNVIREDQRPKDYYSMEFAFPTFPIETSFTVTTEDDPAALAAYVQKLFSRVPGPNAAQGANVFEQIECLALAHNSVALPYIAKLLDGSRDCQIIGVQFLCLYPTDQSVPILTQHFSNLVPQAQVIALSGLRISLFRSATPDALVIVGLRSKDAGVRGAAVECCWNTPRPSCVPILLEMGSDPDPLVRRYLCTALEQADDRRAIPILLKFLHEPDPEREIPVWAASALGHFKRMDGVPVLISLLRNPKMRDYEGNIMDALQTLTGEKLGDNHTRWLEWWKSTGHAKYGG